MSTRSIEPAALPYGSPHPSIDHDTIHSQISREGALALFSRGYADSGAEMAMQLVEVYSSQGIGLDYETSIAAIIEIDTAMADSTLPDGEPPLVERARFLKAALSWSADVNEIGAYTLGDPRIHALLGASSWAAEEDVDAGVKHQVLGEVPDELAVALTNSGCGALKRDGLACRAVLQFLAVENLRDAATFLAKFRSLVETDSRYTLFCALIIETCQHDAGETGFSTCPNIPNPPPSLTAAAPQTTDQPTDQPTQPPSSRSLPKHGPA